MKKTNFKKSFGLVLLSCLMPFALFAQTVNVKGVVTDQKGEPLPGVSVKVVDANTGALTDLDGAYTVKAASNASLQFSFVGFESQTIAVAGKSVINVVLKEDTKALEDVVVIGYGTAKKTEVTGSIVSMNGDNIRQVAANDITHSLQGRVAGVQMTQTSSRPGSTLEIRIRGERSLNASNDPLIVLDGVPFMGSLSDISTSDIKSMDILKDASATAIYGSRGANGVILISTYKGYEGQEAVINFNNYVGAKVARKYPMMNTEEYTTFRDIAGQYVDKIGYEDRSVDTDWQDLFYRTGIVQNHELSVTGGTKTGAYRFGINYYRDQAVIPTQDYDRLSINGSLDQNLTKWLKVGFSTNTNFNNSNGNQLGLYSILQLTPMMSPYDQDGNLLLRQQMPNDNVYVLTRETIENLGDSWVNQNRNFGTYNSAYAEFTIIDGLKFKETGSYNLRTTRNGSFTGEGVNSYDPANPNSASTSTSETRQWSLESLLTYDKIFGEKHHLNLTGLFTAEQLTYQYSGLSARNIPNEQFMYYNLGQANSEDITVSPNNANYYQAGLVSYMFRAMYTYDERYMISAAVRSDASSRLAEGHQTHVYPAVSAGWNMHNEEFLAGADWLDELKLRVGYGETSNQAIDPYQTLGSLGTRPYNFGDTYATGYYVATLPNDELGWEYSKTWNFGVDFGFFNGRLNGSIEYYSQKTNDILLSLSLPSTAGVGSYTANIGNTQNKGIEFTVGGTIIDTKDWKWTAGINIYANRNKLTALADGTTQDKSNQWFVGYPINCIYDYVYDGLWQEGDQYMDILEPGAQPGDIKVKYYGEYNEDGSPVRAINSDDRQPISTEANFEGGFNTTLSYKNWDLTVLGNFQNGGILISTLHTASGYLNMNSGRRGQIKVDYWTPENTGAKYPRPGGLSSNDNPKYGSTLGYFDGSFLKIGTITLGYNFDKLPALKKAGIERLRVYATLQNPFVLFSEFSNETGLDPEPNAYGDDTSFQATSGYLNRQKVVGTNTPNTRNYLFGVNLTF